LCLAQYQIAELSRHERIVECSMPGELSLTPRSTILFEGTGSAFDQVYYVDSIERVFAQRRGFVQHLRLISASPRTNVVLPSENSSEAAA